jgi:hypothetical protein
MIHIDLIREGQNGKWRISRYAGIASDYDLSIGGEVS